MYLRSLICEAERAPLRLDPICMIYLELMVTLPHGGPVTKSEKPGSAQVCKPQTTTLSSLPKSCALYWLLGLFLVSLRSRTGSIAQRLPVAACLRFSLCFHMQTMYCYMRVWGKNANDTITFLTFKWNAAPPKFVVNVGHSGNTESHEAQRHFSSG